MDIFLQRIADAFFRQYGAEVSERTFVFPNRRAGLFFRRYLSEAIGRPLFSPTVMTISECVQEASGCQLIDRLGALFRLYASYRKVSRRDEGFDKFVFWGEMLLADFDDLDKYLADPAQVFRNVAELKEIDSLFDSFTEAQIATIREFWKNFDPMPAASINREFVTTWKILLPLYEDFRHTLRSEGLATEGMMWRQVAEKLQAGERIPRLEGRQFVFVGFNALTPAERCLFVGLKEQADFYWDYEAPALRDPDNPASRFHSENTTCFPSNLDVYSSAEPPCETEFELWAVPSQVGQAKLVHDLLVRLHPFASPGGGIRTAVVLPEEGMLLPLLHSLPAEMDKVNVTMGFPLKTTPVTGLIEAIYDLQRRKKSTPDGAVFYFRTVLNVLNHQYVSLACGDYVRRITEFVTLNNRVYVGADELAEHPLAAVLFTSLESAEDFLPYLMSVIRQLQAGLRMSGDAGSRNIDLDFLYQYHIMLNRLHDIVRARPSRLDMSMDTLMRLIRQFAASNSLPFVGEPLAGLQVMGMLETRGLDFENLIITSFNEGVFPRRSSHNSFIPYNLRKAFGLPTAEHQDALAAYQFYRLIHRAKRVFLLYDSRTEGFQTGEVSRFAHQLRYHYGVSIKECSMTFDVSFSSPAVLKVGKSAKVIRKLERFLSSGEDAKALSPSSINIYLDCPLQFYLSKVEGMTEAPEVAESIEENMFGTLFHAVVEYTYAPYKGKLMQPADFDRLMNDQAGLDRNIVKAFAVHYFKRDERTPVTLEGNNLLVAHVLKKYVRRLLEIDKKEAPFRYLASEELCRLRYPLTDGVRHVNLKGYIDRVDEKEGKLRIVDYKTGSGSLDFKSVESLFDSQLEKRPKHVLQTFFYGLFYKEKAKGKPIVPSIYYMRDMFKDNFKTHLSYHPAREQEYAVNDFADYEEEFRNCLSACLEEIFDPTVPFIRSENTKPCQYCPHRSICNR